jgi:hypothetical protein
MVSVVSSYRDEFGQEVEFSEPDQHIPVYAKMYKLNEQIDHFRPVQKGSRAIYLLFRGTVHPD